MATDVGTVTIDAKELGQSVTLHVRLGRGEVWAWRLKIASWLIRLAAWIMWVNLELEEVECLAREI